jgi:hypothetical protein
MTEMTTNYTKIERTQTFLNYIHNDRRGEILDTGMHTYMDVIQLFINNDYSALDTYKNYINKNPSYHFPSLANLQSLIDSTNYYKQQPPYTGDSVVAKRSFEYQFCLGLWLDIHH